MLCCALLLQNAGDSSGPQHTGGIQYDQSPAGLTLSPAISSESPYTPRQAAVRRGSNTTGTDTAGLHSPAIVARQVRERLVT